jgi:hypothetical protein
MFHLHVVVPEKPLRMKLLKSVMFFQASMSKKQPLCVTKNKIHILALAEILKRSYKHYEQINTTKI